MTSTPSANPYAEATDDVLVTLGQQAHDAHCSPPLCKPFRADILANMVRELQCWRRFNKDYCYSPETDMLVPK